MLENLFYDVLVLNEGNDAHRPVTLGAREGVYLVYFLDKSCPVPEAPLSFFPDNLTTLQEQEKSGYDQQPHDDPFKGLLIDVCDHPPRDPYGQRDEQENPPHRHQHVKDACIQKSWNFDQVKQGKKVVVAMKIRGGIFCNNRYELNGGPLLLNIPDATPPSAPIARACQRRGW